MKIKSISIRNFRSYKEEIHVDFDDLTAFVGKNDIGKSTIIEALDIFFNDNKGTVKIDKSDLNVTAQNENDTDIHICVHFVDLPGSIIIDASNKTTLRSEYLLNENGELEILKKYTGSGSSKVFIRALHPANPDCSNLLLKKDSELRTIIKNLGIEHVVRATNASMRSAIWKHFNEELQLQSTLIDVTKGETKSIWEKLQKYLPNYYLFQADRKNSEGDAEIQDPLRIAVQNRLKKPDIQKKLNEIAEFITQDLQGVADETLAILKDMDQEIARNLSPVIPPVESLKWAEVFKNVSICDESVIPINKHGSGVKRMILLSFFQAEVKRRAKPAGKAVNSEQSACEPRDDENSMVIYAIEEPETAQHTNNQRLLVDALKKLSASDNTQVILTTHSTQVVKQLNPENLRVIRKIGDKKVIEKATKDVLPFRSLNEINYQAFSEYTFDYHDELYGHLKDINRFEQYEKSLDRDRDYFWPSSAATKWVKNDPNTEKIEVETEAGKTTLYKAKVTLTMYIRHRMHHPENRHNTEKITDEDLKKSIELMRNFLLKMK